MKVRKGDKVIVIAGKDRGKSGTVARAYPKDDRVLIDGINMVKRHRRARTGGKGQIIEKPMALHVSNVQLVDPKTGKGTRVSIQRKDGVAVRVAKKSGSVIK